uniref:Membrane protein YfhO n=1 Tax=Candidatus Kentrum sp. SD TaxID=2126332 RepID=A0A451BMM8_9GAMM|nr:MAG: membrane protein YfhO [Candidatus Kentron sp. SD]
MSNDLNNDLLSDRQKNILAIVSLAILWFYLLFNAQGSDQSFALYMDNEFFIGPVLSSMSAAFDGGEWPLRMTTALGGVPIYNLAQLSPFYPLYFAPLPLFATPIDAAISMHWITVLHILLFAINMFILLRVLGTSRLGAVTGATFVAFGANSLSYAAWVQIVAPYAWFPLYLAGLIGVLENRLSVKYPSMAIGGIVLLVLASPAQPLIHAVLVTCALGIFRWWHNRANAMPHATRSSFLKLLSIAIVAFLLAAPAILPVVIEFKDMIRWIGPYPAVAGHDQIPFEAFLIDQLSIAELGGVLVKISQKAVGSQFIGPIALSLALFALTARSRSWIATAMVAIAVYALISSAGSNLGLAYVNYVLPLVNKIREPSRFLFLFQLAIGILAALGIDELRRIVVNKQLSLMWRRQGMLVVAIALVTLTLAFGLRDHGTEVISALIASVLLIVLLVISIFVARTSWRFRGELIGLSWSTAVLVILAINVSWVPPPIAASHYLDNDGIALDMAISRVAELDPRHEYRLIFEGSIDKQMAAMLASYKGVRTLNSYFNPAPLRQFQDLYHHGPRTDNYLQVLGARYLICRDCAGVKYRGFEFIESIHGYDIYEASDALPYIQLLQQLDGRFDGLPDFIAKTVGHDLNQGLLFVEPGTAITLDEKGPETSDCIVRNDIRKKNRIRYLVSCGSPSVLILNEFYADPWRVTINGVKSNALRVNGNQIGVQLGRGGQVVEFTYRPWTFSLSIVLAVIGIALVLLWALRTKYEERY